MNSFIILRILISQFSFINLELKSEIEIIDLSGRRIYKEIIYSDFHYVDISDILPGLYYVCVMNGSNEFNYIEQLIIL